MNDDGQDAGKGQDAEPIIAGERPFRLYNPDIRSLPIVLAVPHAGRGYSHDLLSAMRDPVGVPARLEDRHVDTLALAILDEIAAPAIIAEAPRALIDLNRAEDDIDWGMVRGSWRTAARHSAANRRARNGLGLVPRRLPVSGEIWRAPLTERAIAERIDTVHRPYHARIASLLEAQRDRWGAALLVDLHSMPPLAPKLPGDEPARVVIGDRFGASCDPSLSATALHSLAAMAWRASHNRPYAGGYVLERHGRPCRGIHALQIEVCRTTYLERDLSTPSAQVATVAADLARLLRDLAAQTAALGRSGGLSLAAE